MFRISLFLMIVLPFACLAQSNTTGAQGSKTVVSKLVDFSKQHPTEKTYLHFDKPYYAAGDTIYFKAYVTLGEQHQLSGLSGVLHVDLINANNKIDGSVKIQLANGIGWGDFALPDSLPKGNYRVRAYTQWMRNDGNYFEQKIPVGSVHTDKIPESSTAKTSPAGAKPDLQFFPEGGTLIAGLRTKIAFKAIGRDGLGVDFKGAVNDNSGKIVTEFASTHLGMGYFYMQSEEGRYYSADITYADGSRDKISLPLPAAGGITLAVNNDSIPNSTVKIQANAAYFKEHKGEDFTLLIYSGGVAVTVNCKLDSAEIALDIIKRRLHTGVARLTLFSPSGEPLAERLVFIQRFDQLDLALSSDKANYLPREKATIRINAKNRADEPAMGHFSISVVDESKVPADDNAANTILTDLLLTSDLKGYIEQPNYYFSNVTAKTQADLDLVMLTHEYRKFDWKPLLNNEYPPIAWQPEKGLEISGTAKSVFGRPLNKGTISLIAKRGAGFATATTDDKGRFRFTGLTFTDTAKFILQAVNAKGSDNTKLIYDKDIAPPDVIPALTLKNNDVNQSISSYLDNSKLQQDEIAKYGTLNGRMLKTVNIKDKKMSSRPLSVIHPISPEFVNQEIHGDELEKAPGISLTEKVLSKFYGRGRTPALIVVDGVAGIDAGGIIASDVESVEAVYDANAAIYGIRAAGGINGGGVWIIETKKGKGKDPKDITSIGILPISPKGFYKAREFYAPKYDPSELKNNRPDLRSTIFWQSELLTDKDGNASIEYYNADGRGTYRVTIEGIDNKGNLGRLVFRYQVE